MNSLQVNGNNLTLQGGQRARVLSLVYIDNDGLLTDEIVLNNPNCGLTLAKLVGGPQPSVLVSRISVGPSTYLISFDDQGDGAFLPGGSLADGRYQVSAVGDSD